MVGRHAAIYLHGNGSAHCPVANFLIASSGSNPNADVGWLTQRASERLTPAPE